MEIDHTLIIIKTLMYKTQNSLFDSQLYTRQNGRRISSDMYHQYHGLYSKNPIKL